MGKRKSRQETSSGGVVFRRGADGARFLLILDSHGNWGFPKGHIEAGEAALAAALREVTEETGLNDLILHAELGAIDWYFRTRENVVHKYCHMFLFESPGAPHHPQAEEGITACEWYPLEDALATIAYENSRGVLRQAGTLVDGVRRQETTAPER